MNLLSPLFSKKLILWYLENKRDLPWRHTKDPYIIWLAEIILQQTRVDQGMPYFFKFTNTYPTVQDLANASEQEVLKLWQGLGYYSRARNLLEAAKTVVQEMNGVFPGSYKELLTLKGVGDYTASAIASICFDEPVAVVDGNVYRVLSRVFGIETPINTSVGIKEFKSLAGELIDPERPAVFNQALMEFGAIHCTPRNPNCFSCVFREGCVAFQTGKVQELPVKLKTKPVQKRFFNYLIIENEAGNILMERREEGIWQGLFQFPLIESTRHLNVKQLMAHPDFQSLQKKFTVQTTVSVVKNKRAHKLSHQHIYVEFWKVSIKGNQDYFLSEDQVKQLPVPILLAEFISAYYKKAMENDEGDISSKKE